jgi:hypothetical protein
MPAKVSARVQRRQVAGAFKPAISLTDAMTDPALFGSVFSAPSFWTWKTVAKLIDGIPLSEPREVELYKTCTGRSKLPNGPVKRLIILAGRRAGKDRWVSAVSVWRAALCADWRKYMSAGEPAVVTLLGADRRQAGILRRYLQGLLEAPLLAREVVRATDDVVEFRNTAVAEVSTNDAALVRGRSAVMVAGSESCFWKTDEASKSSDAEVVAAAEPAMAMCPDHGLLVLGSSVFRKRGYMWQQYKAHHGVDESDTLCWFAPSQTMNPALPTSVIDKALAHDGSRARAEYLNIWREDTSDYIPADVVESATDFGILERAPSPEHGYFAFADAASGLGSDSFAFAIAHRCKDDIVVLDVLREFKPRFVPAVVIGGELTALCRAYRVTRVKGDSYSIGFHRDEWRRNGIEYVASEHTTSEIYLHLLPTLLSGRLRLIDNATLRSQFCSLERRLLPTSGREIISHAQVASAHDDLCCAASGALVAAARPRFDAVPMVAPLFWSKNNGWSDEPATAQRGGAYSSWERWYSNGGGAAPGTIRDWSPRW